MKFVCAGARSWKCAHHPRRNGVLVERESQPSTGFVDGIRQKRWHAWRVLSREAFVRLGPLVIKSMLFDMYQRFRHVIAVGHIIEMWPVDGERRALRSRAA